MTTKEDMERLYPSNRQEGGDHYAKHNITYISFISSNNLSFFKAML
jgi:hypothetical protein